MARSARDARALMTRATDKRYEHTPLAGCNSDCMSHVGAGLVPARLPICGHVGARHASPLQMLNSSTHSPDGGAMTSAQASQTVLITGASSGIGYELSRLFARDRYNLVLVARSEQRLNEVAAELQQAHGSNVRVLV